MSHANGDNQRISILVVDDYEPWRRSVCYMLKAQPDLRVIGEACDGFEAIRKAAELRPDLVLLDIGMPGLNGIDAAQIIRLARPAPKIVFLTQDNDTDLRNAALDTGAEGYVAKMNAATELLSAIATALNGGPRLYTVTTVQTEDR